MIKKEKFNMDFWENIEAYINNELPEAERQAFDNAMTTDAALRQSVDEQRLIINLLRQNRSAIVAHETAADASKRQRLKGIIDGYVAELPDALPVEMPKKAENTEGVKIVPLKPTLVKKTNYWWAAAASLAVVAAASMWVYQQNKTPQPTVAQTPIVVLPVDTLAKNGVPTVEKPLVIQPKETPQYSTEKKEKTEIAKQNKEQKASETPKTPIETPQNNDAILAVLENVASKEYEQITEPTKGTSSNAISKEDQTLLKALEAISANKPTVALDILQGRDDEKARYYRALATLLMDKKKGKQALEALANDTGLEVYFRNKIKTVLGKLD